MNEITAKGGPEYAAPGVRVEVQFIEAHGHQFTHMEMAGCPIKYLLDIPEARLLALPEFGAGLQPMSEQTRADSTLVRACVASMRSQMKI